MSKDCCNNCKEGKTCCSETSIIEAKFTDDTLAPRIKHWASKHKGTGIGYGHVLGQLAVHMKEMGWNKSYKEVARVAVELGKKKKVESVNEGTKAFLAYREMKEALNVAIYGIKKMRKFIDDAPYNPKFNMITKELYKWEIDLEKKWRRVVPQISKISKDKMLEAAPMGRVSIAGLSLYKDLVIPKNQMSKAKRHYKEMMNLLKKAGKSMNQPGEIDTMVMHMESAYDEMLALWKNVKEVKKESINEAGVWTDKDWRIAHGIFIKNKFFPTMQKNFEKAIKDKDVHNLTYAIEGIIRYMRNAPKKQLGMKIKESINEDNFRSRAQDDIDDIHTSVKYLASKIAKEDRKHGTKATREYIKFYKQYYMKFHHGVIKSAFNLLADGVIKKESVNEAIPPEIPRTKIRLLKMNAKYLADDLMDMYKELNQREVDSELVVQHLDYLKDKVKMMRKNMGLRESVNESGILYRAGVKKYGKEGMRKIQQAAGKRKSHAEIGKIKDKYEKDKKESVVVEFSKYRLGGLLDSKLKKRLERTIKVIGGKVDAVGDDYVKFRIGDMALQKLPAVITKLDRNKNVWIGDKLNRNIWDRKRHINKLNEAGMDWKIKNKKVDAVLKGIIRSMGLKTVKDFGMGQSGISFFIDDEKEAKKLHKLLTKQMKNVRIINLDKSKGDVSNHVVYSRMFESEQVDEGFGSPELMKKKDLAEFEKTRQKNAEVLGYKLTGRPDHKPMKEKTKVTSNK